MMAEVGKLERARLRVCLSAPVVGSLLYGTPCEPFSKAQEAALRARGQLPTMATDGKRIFYSEAWVERHSVEEVMGVLVHEILHQMLGHHLRFDMLMRDDDIPEGSPERARRHVLANMAMDYALNPYVRDMGLKLPAGALIDSKWDGMSWEEIYRKLGEDAEQEARGYNGVGEVLAAPGITTEAGARAAQAEIEATVRQAIESAKTCGDIPAALQKLVKGWDEAKIDWRTRLWCAVDAAGGTMEDQSWEIPDRRFIQHGLYLPHTVRHGLGDVAMFVDSSGSMSDEEFRACLAEVAAIVNDLRPARVIYGECGTGIPEGHPLILESGEEFPTEITRRRYGGTSFEPPFRWLRDNGITPQWMIYLTDGYGDFPEDPPPWRVIWVMTSDVEAPWGTTIRLRVQAGKES